MPSTSIAYTLYTSIVNIIMLVYSPPVQPYSSLITVMNGDNWSTRVPVQTIKNDATKD